MIGFPFDSHVNYDDEGVPQYDRAITSEPYRKLLKELFKTGVMPSLSTNMQVSAGTGMNVIVGAGFAMVEGCMKLEEENRTLSVKASSSTLDRIDTVVLRLDDNDDVRICDFYIVEGTPSASPVRPELTRSGAVYEIGLADIFISRGDTQISNTKITDTRYESARCGVISSISEFDTTTLNQQINAWCVEQRADFLSWRNTEEQSFTDWRAGEEETFSTWESEQEADYATWSEAQRAIFDAWFETIRDILDTNVADHLQNEVDALDERLETAEDDIDSLEGRMTTAEGNIETLTGTTLTETLTAGSTSLTFTDESITNTSMIDIYADVYGVSPKTATLTSGSLVLEFNSLQTNISVKVVIK